MRLGLITDPHLGPVGASPTDPEKLTHQAEALTVDVVRRWRDQERPDLILNLGDVLDDVAPDVDRGNYQRFLQLLAAAGAPALHVAGNHDQENLTDDDLWELWRMPGDASRHGGSTAYAVSRGGVRFVALSTRWAPPEGVFLGPGQIEFLRDELDGAGGPAIVLCHQGLADASLVGNHWFEAAPQTCLVHERAEVRRVIEHSDRVIAVFHGHAHWNHVAVVRGVPYVTLQSLTENVTRGSGRPTAAAASAIVDVDVDRWRLRARVDGAQPARYQFDRTAGSR